MKIKVLTDNIKVEVQDDFKKAKEYFKEVADFDVSFYFQEWKPVNPTKTFKGTGWVLEGFNNQIKNIDDYDMVIYAFNDNDYPDKTFTSAMIGWVKPYITLISLVTNKTNDRIGWIWKSITHEIMHGLCQKAYFAGYKVVDQMDRTNINGNWISYYQNNDPYAKEGNYAKTFEGLMPYLNSFSEEKKELYIPKDFDLQEFVSPGIYEKFGEKAWQFLDERLLRNIQWLRDELGSITVNNYKWGGSNKYRGFDEGVYRKTGTSQHNMGRALDFDVKGKTAQEVRKILLERQNELPEPNIWVENDVNWVHMDVRYSDKKGAYFFKQ